MEIAPIPLKYVQLTFEVHEKSGEMQEVTRLYIEHAITFKKIRIYILTCVW